MRLPRASRWFLRGALHRWASTTSCLGPIRSSSPTLSRARRVSKRTRARRSSRIPYIGAQARVETSSMSSPTRQIERSHSRWDPSAEHLERNTRADISVRLQPTVGHPPRDVDECCCDRWTQRSPDRLFGCRRAGNQRPCHRLPGRGSVRSEWVHRELPGGQPGRQSGRVDLGFAVPCQRGPPHAAHVRPVR